MSEKVLYLGDILQMYRSELNNKIVDYAKKNSVSIRELEDSYDDLMLLHMKNAQNSINRLAEDDGPFPDRLTVSQARRWQGQELTKVDESLKHDFVGTSY